MADTYLKPQSALKHMDDYIYPLTTADQVIVDNEGTRLNERMSGMLYAEEVDSEGGGVKIDAASVLGETPESIYNKLYPIGSIYTTTINTNPGLHLGENNEEKAGLLGFGSWELVGKGFKDQTEANAEGLYFTPNTTNVSAHNVVIVKAGSTVSVRLDFTNAVAIGTTELNMGSFNLDSIGITSFPRDIFYLLGGSVTGSDAFLYRVYANGEVHVLEYISSSIAKAQTCYSYFTVTIPHELMLDSACDKFYWKRTA